MSILTPKSYTPLSEAVIRLGQSRFPEEWTGEEFLPEVASVAKIDLATLDHLIGWVRARCAESQDRIVTEAGHLTSRPRIPLGLRRNWEEATEIYAEARSLIDEIALTERIEQDGGWLGRIRDRYDSANSGLPENFPLSRNDLADLATEEKDFRAPRDKAFMRLNEVARRLQQELCGTPPDAEDAIPAVKCSPDEMPKPINPVTWVGPAGLSRLKRAASGDRGASEPSRIFLSLHHIENLCASLATPTKKTAKAEGDCQEWLSAKVANWRPDSTVPRKPDLLKEACALFPGLSERGFRDRIWPATVPPEWKRRGPKGLKKEPASK